MNKLKDKTPTPPVDATLPPVETTPPPAVANPVPTVNVGDRVNYVTRESQGGETSRADVTAVGANGLISVRTVAKEPITADNVPYYPATELARKKRTNTWHLAEGQ
jgi:hypothetical protein